MNTAERIYKIKTFIVNNHYEIWNTFKDYFDGTSENVDLIWEFFTKLALISLQKAYPDTPDKVFQDQHNMLSDLISDLYDYYLNKDEMQARIFDFFPNGLLLVDTEQNEMNRRIFAAHFLNKTQNLLKDGWRKSNLINRNEQSVGEWVDEVFDGLYDGVRRTAKESGKKPPNLLDEYKKKNKTGQMSQSKQTSHVTPTRAKKTTSPQEGQILLDDTIDEIVNRMSDRKLSGKRIQSTLEEIMDRRKWRESQLNGYYGTIIDSDKTGEYLLSKPELFISGMLFPTSKGLLFCSNCANENQLDQLFKMWLEDAPKIDIPGTEEDRKAAEAVRKRPN